MSTRERAAALLDMMSTPDLILFLNLFGRIYNIPKEERESDEERLARKRAAADRIAARRVPLPPDFDYKKELLEYLDERYGV